MTKIEKITCRRCNGSGHFSFNLVRGTVCFQCNGVGYEMVKTAQIEANLKAKMKRAEAAKTKAALYTKCLEELVAEMNAELGPFDTATQVGMQDLDYAVCDKYKKSIYVLRDERLAKLRELSAE